MPNQIQENSSAIAHWCISELSSGKYLVLPPIIYKASIDFLKQHGATDEVLKNVYESKPLSSL